MVFDPDGVVGSWEVGVSTALIMRHAANGVGPFC